MPPKRLRFSDDSNACNEREVDWNMRSRQDTSGLGKNKVADMPVDDLVFTDRHQLDIVGPRANERQTRIDGAANRRSSSELREVVSAAEGHATTLLGLKRAANREPQQLGTKYLIKPNCRIALHRRNSSTWHTDRRRVDALIRILAERD